MTVTEHTAPQTGPGRDPDGTSQDQAAAGHTGGQVSPRLTKRSGEAYDTEKLVQGIRRHIRHLGSRAATEDAATLKMLHDLKAVIDEEIRTAARALHAGNEDLGIAPVPWEQIGYEFGKGKQYAHDTLAGLRRDRQDGGK